VGTPVAVVCSGVKSILDVPATLEYLETLGVPVVGFCTLRFPGFDLSDSGSPLDWSVESAEEAARVIQGSLPSGSSARASSSPIRSPKKNSSTQISTNGRSVRASKRWRGAVSAAGT
jgi:pseudouridine-5'-phosphate glycosidase